MEIRLRRMMPRSLTRVYLWLAVCALLALVVKARWLAGFDLAVAEWAQGVRTPGRDELARAITFFGSSSWALAAGIVMTGWWARAKRWRTIGAFWVSWGIGLALQSVLRCWVAQWRPDASLAASLHWVADRLFNTGFTSGHAFRSAFIFGWWIDALQRHPARGAWAASAACAVLIVLVGATRVSLHRHWTSDVVGGWVVAMLSLAAARSIRAAAVAKHGTNQV